MYLRRLAVPVAALAAGAAFLPANAFAASAATNPQSSRTPVAHGAAAAAHADASVFKSFSSPASKSVRLQKAAATPARSHTANSGATIWATTADTGCSTDTGDGSQANPYCKVQDAVNAATAGDTVNVLGSVGYMSWDAVTITKSGISIVGIGDQAWILPENGDYGKPAITLDGVSDVTIKNLILTSHDAPSVAIVNSIGVTLDSDYVEQLNSSTSDALTIDGTSSNVTVSRTYLDDGTWSAPGNSAISIQPGARNITLSANLIADAGIVAYGVQGLHVTGNTIQRACAPAIDVENSSLSVSLENNLLEDANPQADNPGGYQSSCTADKLPWNPDVVVSANSAAGTTADYNDFYVYGSDATDPYSWSDTAYPTLGAFQTAVGQGAHDTIDATQARTISDLRPNVYSAIDATLVKGSAAIGSANTAATGQQSSDFYGVSPYTSRGAVQYVPVDPNLTVSLSAKDTSALGISFEAGVTSTDVPVYLSVDWGDGTTSNTSFTGSNTYATSHTFPHAGTYTVSATADDHQGDVVTNTVQVTVAGSDYTAYGPERILDTRHGVGLGGTAAKLGAFGTLKLQVTGAGPSGQTIPAGISAVVLNLTVTGPAAGGYLTAYPNQTYLGGSQTRPTASNLNFSPGQTVPNLAIVPVGPDGIVDLYNGSGGTTDVVADVTGYFSQSAASGYATIGPDRLVDTRTGMGAPKAAVPSAGKLTVQVAGADGGRLPASVTAVALNVTVVSPQAGGYLTVYPDGSTRPTASNLNFGGGQVIANAVIVPVAKDGEIDVFNGSIGSTNVVVDVVGYYSATAGSAYLAETPGRDLDTRTWKYGPLTPGGYAFLYGNLTTTDHNVTAIVFNTTVTNTKGGGYETVSPDPNPATAYQNGTAVFPTPPNVSTLNWNPGQTVPNLVQASTGSTGVTDFWNRSGGNMDLVVDEFGYYQAD